MTALLILIAAVIGYSTAWRYYKSLCIKRMKANELEKGELKSHNHQT